MKVFLPPTNFLDRFFNLKTVCGSLQGAFREKALAVDEADVRVVALSVQPQADDVIKFEAGYQALDGEANVEALAGMVCNEFKGITMRLSVHI